MQKEIFDVILQSTGYFRADVSTFEKHGPPRENFFLGENFWVGSLPKDVDASLVFNACEPAGFNHSFIRQYRMRYAFCRGVRSQCDDNYTWDSESSMSAALFLSRLIRPTTIATELSAKLYFENEVLKTIVPGPTQGSGAHAWVVAKDNWRDWLSIQELEQLRGFLPMYRTDLPDRVRRARKHLVQTFQTPYLDQRCASLVSSFESLLKVSLSGTTNQFASRTLKLARMLGHQLTDSQAREMYNYRSDFVHGSAMSFKDLSDELIEKYNRFECVIRQALLNASTKPAFAEHFSSDKALETAFGL